MFNLSIFLRKNIALFCLLTSSVFANDEALNIESLNIYSTATNRNFKMDLNGQRVFFRIGRNHPDEVGINRETEIEFYKIAESLEIAPKLLGYEINNGLLITEYIEGTSLTEEEIHQCSTIEKIVNHLHLLHIHKTNLSPIHPITVFTRNNKLLNFLENLGLQPKLQKQLDHWLHVKNSIATDYYQALSIGICHGDLFRGNMIQDDKGKLFFIDWEYSFYGYIIDDIGKFCSSNWLNNEEIELVSKMYWNSDDDQLFKKTSSEYFYAAV